MSILWEHHTKRQIHVWYYTPYKVAVIQWLYLQGIQMSCYYWLPIFNVCSVLIFGWCRAHQRKRKYIPIGEVYNRLPAYSASSLLPFHALTGCDVTSYISNHTKRSAWKVFEDNHALLEHLGEGDLTDEISKSAEKLVCRIYNVGQTDSVDEARHIMFYKFVKPEVLPPTSDALHFHLMQVLSDYDLGECQLCHTGTPCSRYHGMEALWSCEGGLEPILMSLSPIPSACLEIISCSCKTQCSTLRCKCRKNGLHCTAVCGCNNVDLSPCLNRSA